MNTFPASDEVYVTDKDGDLEALLWGWVKLRSDVGVECADSASMMSLMTNSVIHGPYYTDRERASKEIREGGRSGFPMWMVEQFLFRMNSTH